MSAKLPEDAALREADRRRSPRFSCLGLAQIIRLPSDGSLLPGTVRDLSLGGCSVLAPRSLTCGALAELLVRVNASSFRAVGQIRAVRGPSAMGIQFLHMSAGGQDMLVELVRELARQRAIAQTVQAARREPDAEFFLQQRAAALSVSFPMEQTVVNLESGEAKTIAVSRQALIVDGELDLFI